MSKRIYVGNLPFDITRGEVDSYFKANAHFVEPPTVEKLGRDKAADSAGVIASVVEGDAQAIAASLNGTKLRGKTIVASTDRSVVINHEEIWWG